jgi:molybdopterin/thiamine biosynthesis adenylyltransferase
MKFDKEFGEVVKNRLKENKPVDLHDLAIDFFRPLLENLVTGVKTKFGLKYFSDPNSIINNEYPSIIKFNGKTNGEINFQDLYSRNPLSEENKLMLRNATVGIIGYGGIQLCSELLVRDGLGHLIISDFDVFESTNANRQIFCNAETLGRNKVEVGEENLKKINSELKVDIITEKIDKYTLEKLYSNCDVIIDSTGDVHMRDNIHDLRKKTGIPTFSWAWAGFEGQYVFMQKDDPLYTKAFSYSPYTDERGFMCSGLSMLNSMLALDVEKYLLGNKDFVKFPEFNTFNTNRKNLVNVRNIDSVVLENKQNGYL